MSIPTIVFDDQSVLIEPSNAELAEKLGLDIKARCTFYDLIVVGGGPTALTAAIYIARDGYDVLVIERSSLGGQAGITERLDNYPGFPQGVTGGEFAERVIEQAKRFDVEMISAQNVVRVGNDLDAHFVETEDGYAIAAMLSYLPQALAINAWMWLVKVSILAQVFISVLPVMDHSIRDVMSWWSVAAIAP
ncbi:NAD(P)/FAD-dependent oxidoreductase [Dictyobacter kobayashii]|uniref:FAD/NAD(P)-binding domain-containing protein n=1 Tax=Dictyobacter kobayashii TaxID=2014872 RepID=A0A402AZG2_9CHLR|nr:FAD-dependent oxidoreductase [Dictyobacter kobayashii]GCE24482.1 hypothetical protein KDK_82820 [Dictyobacter kobayashii]